MGSSCLPEVAAFLLLSRPEQVEIGTRWLMADGYAPEIPSEEEEEEDEEDEDEDYRARRLLLEDRNSKNLILKSHKACSQMDKGTIEEFPSLIPVYGSALAPT